MVGREFQILTVGRRQHRSWDVLCDGYRERIARHATVRERPLKVRGAGEGRARLEAEGRAILEALPDPCWTVALDRRGEMWSSRRLARELGRLRVEWSHPIAFLIGSDLGLDRAVLDSARARISFGRITLAHQLARLVLYEQLYRALSIEAGIKYHRDPL